MRSKRWTHARSEGLAGWVVLACAAALVACTFSLWPVVGCVIIGLVLWWGLR